MENDLGNYTLLILVLYSLVAYIVPAVFIGFFAYVEYKQWLSSKKVKSFDESVSNKEAKIK